MAFAACAQSPAAPAPDPAHETFSAAVVEQVLGNFREAIVTGEADRTIALLDRSLPGYTEFSGDLKVILARNESFRLRYQILQTFDQEKMAVADITLEATPTDGGPAIRRTERLRFTFARDNQIWKIADIQPRDLFSSF